MNKTAAFTKFLFEIAFERYDNDIEAYINDPYPLLFGTREEAEAHKAKLAGGLDPSYFPNGIEDATGDDLIVFEMKVNKDGSVQRTGV